MNLTDFYFLCAFALILLIYYIVPKKAQWFVLLCSSIAYYLLAGNPVLILYPVCSVGLCYLVTMAMTKLDDTASAMDSDVLANQNSVTPGTRVVPESSVTIEDSNRLSTPQTSKRSTVNSGRKKMLLLTFCIVMLLLVLTVLKYLRFSSVSGLLVPLGLSYYTFTLIGYVVDVYYGIGKPQTNLLRLMAFGMYFPTLVSGPIMQYREVEESFFAEHRFDFKEFTYGLQRMLWGFFKKLVIAERLGVVVATVYGDPQTYGGIYVWFAILCFTFQLYTDFSGLMDIVIGISQCFGIAVPENFKTPFFSKSISEYWRHWHITLGVWMKEYVFYRVLRTGAYTRLQKKLKDKLGKKRGKQVSTFVAMFILWLVVGLWHGGNMTYVIGSGLLHWFYIVMEELIEAPASKLWNKLSIDVHARGLEAFRVIRTFVLVNIGNAFFRSTSVSSAVQLFACGFTRHQLGEFIHGGVFGLGLDWIEMTIAVVSLIILLIVSVLQVRDESISVRDRIAARPVVLRFVIWFALLFYVILLGQYGPGYSAAEFIYQGF